MENAVTEHVSSRRAVLAGVAVLPTLAAPAAAIANLTPDPIFAAIEAHRAAYAERVRCLIAADIMPISAIPPAAKEAADAAHDAEYEAIIDLIETLPTSAAGVAAVARYAVDFGEEEWMDVECADGSHQSFMEALMLSIADALDAFGNTTVQS
jgi:hypothetical protein